MNVAKLRSGLVLTLGDINDLDNLNKLLETMTEDDVFDTLMFFQYQAIKARKKHHPDKEAYEWWYKRFQEANDFINFERFLELKVSIGLQSVEKQLEFGCEMVSHFLWKV